MKKSKKQPITEEKPIISVRNLFKQFYSKVVLKNIQLDFYPGHFYALLGHNGAGKSTLLRCLSGMMHYLEGEIEVLELDLKQNLPEIQKHVGLVHEQINYDLGTDLYTFFAQYKTFFSNWDDDLFFSLMEQQKLDLSGEFKNLSRGQRMQMALIANLAKRPKILLIDEITSVLDIYSRNFFVKYLSEFAASGATVIMTTNVIHEIQNYATRCIILKEGSIIDQVDLKDLSLDMVKVRKLPNQSHPIFDLPETFWVGMNSDMSHSYLVPRNIAKKYSISNLLDRRKITLEEYFLYKSKSEMLNK